MHLKTFYSKKTVKRMNEELSAAAVQHYNNLFSENPYMAELDPAVSNDMFHHWQRFPNRRRRAGSPRLTFQEAQDDPTLGWRHIEKLDSFIKLEAAIQQIA